MKTMHSHEDSNEIFDRVRRLTPDAGAVWGKMSAPQMLVHITDATRMATGDLAVRGRKHPARLPPLKQLFIYVLPMPKGLPTARELTSRSPAEFNGEIEAFLGAAEVFVSRDPATPWPAHPIFGAMSRRAWGALVYKHCDHHLRQFGV